MNVNIRYAHITTAVYTYLRYTITSDEQSRTARVLNPRTNEQHLELHDVTVTELGPHYYRIEGVDPDRTPAVWLADMVGCQSCRTQSRITDTDAADVPT